MLNITHNLNIEGAKLWRDIEGHHSFDMVTLTNSRWIMVAYFPC